MARPKRRAFKPADLVQVAKAYHEIHKHWKADAYPKGLFAPVHEVRNKLKQWGHRIPLKNVTAMVRALQASEKHGAYKKYPEVHKLLPLPRFRNGRGKKAKGGRSVVPPPAAPRTAAQAKLIDHPTFEVNLVDSNDENGRVALALVCTRDTAQIILSKLLSLEMKALEEYLAAHKE